LCAGEKNVEKLSTVKILMQDQRNSMGKSLLARKNEMAEQYWKGS
jgi:hypothetical protein